jgi:pseudouridine-5'-phosphate glycosidase
LEYLETMSVPVIGYRTYDFPAFYSRSSGFFINQRADSAAEIARITRTHWDFRMESGIIVANPLPEDRSVSDEVIENAIQESLRAAEVQGIHGQNVTPYLLAKVSELTHGSSMEANLFLLRSNSKLAARIANELSQLAD